MKPLLSAGLASLEAKDWTKSKKKTKQHRPNMSTHFVFDFQDWSAMFEQRFVVFCWNQWFKIDWNVYTHIYIYMWSRPGPNTPPAHPVESHERIKATIIPSKGCNDKALY